MQLSTIRRVLSKKVIMMCFWGQLEIHAIVAEYTLISLIKMIFLLSQSTGSAVSADCVVDALAVRVIRSYLKYLILRGRKLERFKMFGRVVRKNAARLRIIL